MTHEQWTVEPTRRGWLSHLLAPEANARPATVAFVLGAVGAVAFVVSLALPWQTITLPRTVNDGGEGGELAPLVFVADVVSPNLLGQVYTLGVIALLGLVGAVINRSDLALRLRMAAAGVTIGLIGVVVAINLGTPSSLAGELRQYSLGGSFGESMEVSFETGMVCAYPAIVLPMVAIWLASRAAARQARHPGTPDGQAPRAETIVARPPAPEPVEAAAVYRAPTRTELGIEVLDLTVTPER